MKNGHKIKYRYFDVFNSRGGLVDDKYARRTSFALFLYKQWSELENLIYCS